MYLNSKKKTPNKKKKIITLLIIWSVDPGALFGVKNHVLASILNNGFYSITHGIIKPIWDHWTQLIK